MDLKDPSDPEVLQTVEVPGPITDVAYCGGYLAATIAADPESNPGSLYIFSSCTFLRGKGAVYAVACRFCETCDGVACRQQ